MWTQEYIELILKLVHGGDKSLISAENRIPLLQLRACRFAEWSILFHMIENWRLVKHSVGLYPRPFNSITATTGHHPKRFFTIDSIFKTASLGSASGIYISNSSSNPLRSPPCSPCVSYPSSQHIKPNWRSETKRDRKSGLYQSDNKLYCTGKCVWGEYY
jgi:hypothetical protein